MEWQQQVASGEQLIAWFVVPLYRNDGYVMFNVVQIFYYSSFF